MVEPYGESSVGSKPLGMEIDLVNKKSTFAMRYVPPKTGAMSWLERITRHSAKGLRA